MSRYSPTFPNPVPDSNWRSQEPPSLPFRLQPPRCLREHRPTCSSHDMTSSARICNKRLWSRLYEPTQQLSFLITVELVILLSTFNTQCPKCVLILDQMSHSHADLVLVLDKSTKPQIKFNNDAQY